MTKEDKKLLLVDLCARLSYEVKFKTPDHDKEVLQNIDTNGEIWINVSYDIDEVKLYLRPLSSMTDEEKEEFENLLDGIIDGIERWDKPDPCEEYDWLNSHHFDYRGLIEKGLALEAPEGIYK